MRSLKARVLTLLRVLVTGMIFGSAASAAEIHLRDGSLVVGKILRLSDGSDLVIDTEHMGEVTVEWLFVERISGAGIVEVEFSTAAAFSAR